MLSTFQLDRFLSKWLLLIILALFIVKISNNAVRQTTHENQNKKSFEKLKENDRKKDKRNEKIELPCCLKKNRLNSKDIKCM